MTWLVDVRRRAVRLAGIAGVMIAALAVLATAADAASGWTAYVANYGSNIAARFSTASNVTFEAAIPVGTSPQALAITPDGSTAYIANSMGNSVIGVFGVVPLRVFPAPPGGSWWGS